MVRKTVDTYVEVDVDLDEFDDTDLIDELKSRGYEVTDKDDTIYYEDHIHSLKEDFLNWYQLGMKNESFEKTMKHFFLDTIDEYIS